MNNDFSDNIQQKIKTILLSDTTDILKTQEIFELSQKFQHHASVAFLNTYSEIFNESSDNKFKPKDVSRILSSALPLALSQFMSIYKKNPQDLNPLLDGFKKFAQSFPITHSASSNYYVTPMFMSALLFGSNENVQDVLNINPQFFNSPDFINEIPRIIEIAITANNSDAVNKLHKLFPENFNHKIVEMMVKNCYEDLDLIAKIVQSPTFSNNETQVYQSFDNSSKIESSFIGFLATNALNRGLNYDWKIFNHFNQFNQLGLNTNVKITEGRNISNFRFVDLFSESENHEAVFKMFKDLYKSKKFDEADTMLFFRHYLTNESPVAFIKFCSDPFFTELMNSKEFSSPLLNRTEIMQNLFTMETSYEYGKYLTDENIYLNPAIAFLEEISSRYPEDFAKLQIHEAYFPRSNSDVQLKVFDSLSPGIKHIIMQSLNSNLETMVQNPVSAFSDGAVDNLIQLGLVDKKVDIEQTRGIFTVKSIKEIVSYKWNEENVRIALKNIGKKKSATQGVNVFEFLVGENNEPLDVSLVDNITDPQSKAIAKNIILMAYQYKDMNLESPTIIPSEEMFFLDNRIGPMMQRILKTYDDYLHFDKNAAENTLQAQLMMLQNKTSKAVHAVMLDEKERLEKDTRINEGILRTPLNPKM